MLGRDKICAVVAATDVRTMRSQLQKAVRQTGTIELRLDWLEDDREIESFLGSLPADKRPESILIATCRRTEAGGRYQGTVAKELFHLAEAIRAGCTWYDLEIETVRRCAPELINCLLGDGLQLRSAHFFERMPKNLSRVANELSGGRPDAIKIAAHCDSLADARKLARFSRGQKRVVAIPMGDVALPTRILALRERSGFAYAPVKDATALGQTSLAELKGLYRADRVDSQTQVYGVIGDPISHSLSPALQNAGFAARRIDAVYLPFLVHDLKDFVDSIEAFGMRGFSVTLPHKEKIIKYLDDCEPLAARIGAVNTVSVRVDGKLYGYNTDYVGILRTLEHRVPLEKSRVLILGAGGAARAAAFALAQAGSSVCVWARRLGAARTLARAIRGEVIARPQLRHEFFDAIVNATPVGMHPAVDQSPLEARELNCSLVFDTIYRPRVTRLMQLAAHRGIKTVSGLDMFIAQGTAQWEIWTAGRAPVAAMRRSVIAALVREERDVRLKKAAARKSR